MNDAEFIAYAESVCFENPWTAENVNVQLDSEYSVCAVERDTDGEGIGYALGRVSFDEAELYRIAVLPDKRRAHSGSRLLERFVSLCAERGAEKIFLEVRSANVPARRLYEKHGFSEISVRRGYYSDDDAVIYLLQQEKDIALEAENS